MRYFVRFEVECVIEPSDKAITDFHIAFEAINSIIKRRILKQEAEYVTFRPCHVEPLETKKGWLFRRKRLMQNLKDKGG